MIPKQYLQCLSAQKNVSIGTCLKACKKIVHLYPYEITLTHELLPSDLPRCIQYCERFNEALNTDDILDATSLIDVHLSRDVNSALHL